MKKLLLIVLLLVIQQICAQSNFENWASGKVSFRDTVGSSIDTLSRHISVTSNSIPGKLWIRGWIWSSDTIMVSTNINFTEGNVTIVYPNETYVLPMLAGNIFNNLYFKNLFTGNHTGTASMRAEFLWK